MARYIGAKCRQCRREGQKLFLKGEKCYTAKCPIETRAFPPGQHGQRRSRLSNYAVQLREKQKLRRIYGMLERQFRRYYAEADRRKGSTGENLLKLLESRLDSVVYRLGLARSRSEARQLIRHNAVLVNGRKLNIPSAELRANDVIELSEAASRQERVKASLDLAQQHGTPGWLDLAVRTVADRLEVRGVFKGAPERSDLPAEINEQLVVELYSK